MDGFPGCESLAECPSRMSRDTISTALSSWMAFRVLILFVPQSHIAEPQQHKMDILQALVKALPN